MKKVILISTLLLLIVIPLISAQPPVTTIQQFPNGYVIIDAKQDFLELGKDYIHHWIVYNYSNGIKISNSTINCTMYMADSYGEVSLTSKAKYDAGGFFYVNISGSNFSKTGIYTYGIDCIDTYGGALAGGFEVTLTGYPLFSADPRVFATSSLIIFFLSLMFIFHYTTKKINYEKWYNNIIAKWEHKNYIKVIISSIGYNLMKNKFIWYYAFAFPVILGLTELVYYFGVESFVSFIGVLLNIYYLGIILVSVYFFGFLQEWIVNLVDDIKNLNFGVSR